MHIIAYYAVYLWSCSQNLNPYETRKVWNSTHQYGIKTYERCFQFFGFSESNLFSLWDYCQTRKLSETKKLRGQIAFLGRHKDRFIAKTAWMKTSEKIDWGTSLMLSVNECQINMEGSFPVKDPAQWLPLRMCLLFFLVGSQHKSNQQFTVWGRNFCFSIAISSASCSATNSHLALS